MPRDQRGNEERGRKGFEERKGSSCFISHGELFSVAASSSRNLSCYPALAWGLTPVLGGQQSQGRGDRAHNTQTLPGVQGNSSVLVLVPAGNKIPGSQQGAQKETFHRGGVPGEGEMASD